MRSFRQSAGDGPWPPPRCHNIDCIFCCSKSIVNIDFGLGPKTVTVIPLVGIAASSFPRPGLLNVQKCIFGPFSSRSASSIFTLTSFRGGVLNFEVRTHPSIHSSPHRSLLIFMTWLVGAPEYAPDSPLARWLQFHAVFNSGSGNARE